MTRDDLLKKCVDKGVADETSVGAVSHLFYVYLLSALQRGQRVEVPNFGTFGTRVVGVKRARKMPYFEVEPELASMVNERYRGLKYLVIGKYELIPAVGDVEYTGRQVAADVRDEPFGKELIFDLNRDITLEEYERGQMTKTVPPPSKEKPFMPTLNLKDEGMEDKELKPVPPVSTPPQHIPGLREPEPSGGMPLLLQVLIAVIILGALAFALNYFGVIHLWGTKQPTVEILPPQEPAVQPETMTQEPVQKPDETPAQTEMAEAAPGGTQAQEQTPTQTPLPLGSVAPSRAKVTPGEPLTPVPGVSEKPPATQRPMGTGNFTVQASSWMTDAKAQMEASKLTRSGFPAYVQEAMVGGDAWYRVRIGRFATHQEAEAEANRLRQIQENGIWVTRVGSR